MPLYHVRGPMTAVVTIHIDAWLEAENESDAIQRAAPDNEDVLDVPAIVVVSRRDRLVAVEKSVDDLITMNKQRGE
jgi:hypothetical protein